MSKLAIFDDSVESLESIIKFPTTSEKKAATPKGELVTFIAFIYLTAGPLIACSPISGEIATTFFRNFVSNSPISFTFRIGLMLDIGLAGAITINSEFFSELSKLGFAVELSAPL